MKNVFVPTQNYQRFTDACYEASDSPVGRGLVAATGLSDTGKTTAAQKFYSTNKSSIYCLYQEGWGLVELLREITFRMCGVRPRFRQQCFEELQYELASNRHLLLIDEVDRAPMKCLNMLRNLHDIFEIPIVLLGEESLKPKLARERRLSSRLRDIIEFKPVSQPDIMIFFRQALDIQLPEKLTVKLLQHAKGSFRNVVDLAVKAERIMKASGITTLTERIVDEICKNGRKNS